jgi:hypothetical protein
MKDQHEACSERLARYVGDALSEGERAEVDEHLAGCEGCRAELSAVRALQSAAPSAAPMNDLERAQMHRAVNRELFTVPDVTPKRSLGAKLIPMMGAAALVVALGFFLTNVNLGGFGGDDDAGDAATGRAEGGAGTDHSDLLELGGPPIAGSPTLRAGAEGTTFGASAEEEVDGSATMTADAGDEKATDAQPALESSAEPPRPRFTRKGGRFTREDATRFGRSQEPFTTFARHYAPSDIAELSVPYAAAIASAGTTDQERRAIETCSAQVTSQEQQVLPAFGAYGRLDGTPVLVLGFVYPTSPSSPALDRFMLWIWPRDDCGVPLAALSGKID